MILANLRRVLLFQSLWLIFAGGLAAAEPRPNVLLICVDDLRPELACFGKDYIHSPNIDRLAASGRPAAGRERKGRYLGLGGTSGSGEPPASAVGRPSRKATTPRRTTSSGKPASSIPS